MLATGEQPTSRPRACWIRDSKSGVNHWDATAGRLPTGGNATITTSSCDYISATWDGGGAYNTGGGNLWMTGGEFHGNTSTAGDGGGFFNNSGTSNFTGT